MAGVTIVTVVTFYWLMDNAWVFYLCVMVFYASMAIFSTIVTISTSFMYDHSVGKRLQKYMYCAFGAAGVLTVVGLDCGVLQGFG
jgi:hypothetical protein